MIDYKRIIKNPKARQWILSLLRFVPDKTMLHIQYRIKTGRKLNLRDPQRYTEKLQWYKLYYRDPTMKQCVDKYTVRQYVADKDLGNTLVPLVGVFDSVDDISWDALPDSFVLKTTNGGGGLNVYICMNKSEASYSEIRKKFSDSRPTKAGTGGREWAYYGLRPKIIAEQLLLNEKNPKAGINDYKIFCYNGKPKYIVVDVERYIKHKRNFYDTEWNNLHITSDCPAADREIERPAELNEMLRVAEILSADFPYVRVDLYGVEGKVYFGELTFYPWSGYVQYEPDEADFIFGENFELKKFKGNNG